MKLSNWQDVLSDKLATMTDEERRAYDDYDVEAEPRIRTAELACQMRTAAGLTQEELAQRVGTKRFRR